MCMGVMSKTGQLGFCIRKNCSTKSHQTNKFSFGSDDNEAVIFIVWVAGSNVFAEPCVKEGLVPSPTLAEWRSMSTTLPNWVKAFRSVAITVDADAPSGVSGFKETKFMADAKTFRTPFKKRKQQEQESMKDEGEVDKGLSVKGVKFARHERGLPPVSAVEELDLMVASGSLGKGGLTKIVANVETSVVNLGDALEEVASVSLQRFVENEKETRAMMGVVQNLFATLGPTVEIDERHEAPTLWGTTAFIAEDVVNLGNAVASLEADVKPMGKGIQDLMALLDKSASDIATNRNQSAQAMEFIMTHVRKVGEELVKVRSVIKQMESSGRGGPSGKKAVSPTKVSDFFGSETESGVDPFLEEMRSKARKDEDEGRRGERLIGDAEGISEILELMMSDVARLELEVKMLKAYADSSAVKFGGLGLKSLEECHSWVKAHFDENRYGLVMDPLLMLERIFGGDQESGQMKILESRKKLNIKTGSEATALTALAYPRPRQFHNDKVAMTTELNSSRLSKLPSYKSWNSGGQGVRNYITKQMN